MQEVRRTITIELEVDLVGTFVPGEAATHNNTANEPMIVDLHVDGIRGERKSYTPGAKTITENILGDVYDAYIYEPGVQAILQNIADLVAPEVEPEMIDDATRGVCE